MSMLNGARIETALLLVVIVLAWPFAGNAVAATTTVSCDKVAKKATTTADSGHSIQYTVGDQTCDFTIDGANASTSNVPTDMGNALGVLTSNDAQVLGGSRLAALIGQLIGIPNNLIDGLSNRLAEADLEACASLFNVNLPQQNASTTFLVQKDELTCGLVRPSAELIRIPNESAVRFSSDQEIVVVSVKTNQGSFGRLSPRSLLEALRRDPTLWQRI